MKYFLYLFVLLIIIFDSSLFSNQIDLKENIGKYSLGLGIEYFEDKSSSLLINDIIDNDTIIWEKSKTEVPAFGFSNSSFWFKTNLQNLSNESIYILEVSYPPLRNIELYYFDNSTKTFIKRTAGSNYQFSNRDLKYYNHSFKLNIPKKSNLSIVLKFSGNSSMVFPLTIWNYDSLLKQINNEKFIFGSFVGILMIMFFYNFFIFVSLRDKNYVFYLLYIVGITFAQLSQKGLGFEYIWFNYPFIENHALPFFVSLTIFSACLFTKYFLNIRFYSKYLDIYLNGLSASNLIALILSFFISYKYSIKLSSLIAMFSVSQILMIGFYSLSKKYKPARFFLIAWSTMLIGMLFYGFRAFGLIPSNFISENGIWVGSVFEVTLLSLALADRINIMKKEKEIAQEEVISIQKNYTQSLERTVQERTSELEIERNKLKSKNEIMEEDIALAKRIQLQLIPEPNPTDYIYSLYKPMHEVGGDLYDFIQFRNSNKIGIFISDVSGHGVPAAFITSMIKTTILQSGNRKDDPAELMNYINEVLQNQTAENFITAFYGIYEPDNKSLLYANAGHPQPYVITDDGVTQLPKGRNTALAMFTNSFFAEKNKTYQNFNVTLPAKSKLLLYTDGLTEACPIGSNIFFEDDIMMEVFLKNRNLTSQLFINKLYESLITFRGEDSFEDDVCLVCIDVI